MDRRDSDNQYQALPAKPSPWVSWVGRLGLKLLGGWQVQGQLPDIPKAIIAIAPHTSNWDFFVGLMVKFKLGLEVNFLGKHSLFRFPIKGFLTCIGGIPVQRDSAHGVVGSMCQAFAAREQLVLVIAPEGTRKRVAQWKTGFLHIAKHAQVPVIPVALDYQTRQVRIGKAVEVTEDIHSALLQIQHFTSKARGKILENE